VVRAITDRLPFQAVKQKLEQYLRIRHLFLGDYYPLTEYSHAKDAWLAYQFDRPDLGEGLVVAFKRPLSPFSDAVFPLHGLDAAARYMVSNLDTGERVALAGTELMAPGLAIHLEARPDSALIVYGRGNASCLPPAGVEAVRSPL
jgi:alpha-galactosidase